MTRRAVSEGAQNIVRLLLHNGASLTLKNREGLSPVQVLLRTSPRPWRAITLT